jgi:16S rRNA (guanine527-N7)-methyltransferase
MTKHNPTVHGVGSDEWRRFVASGANDLGIDVSDPRMDQLVLFAQTLLQWNRRINLTAITDPHEMAVKHFIDSMAALPYIQDTGRLLDIGSGGGFPGLVMAIFRPSLEITSIDSVRKKISFQQHLIRTLALDSARALHVRAETLPEANRPYDIIVSRALGSLEMFTNLALPMLSEKGRVIAYKGVMDGAGEDEVQNLKAVHPELSLNIQSYQLPASGDRRSLIFIKRT